MVHQTACTKLLAKPKPRTRPALASVVGHQPQFFVSALQIFPSAASPLCTHPFLLPWPLCFPQLDASVVVGSKTVLWSTINESNLFLGIPEPTNHWTEDRSRKQHRWPAKKRGLLVSLFRLKAIEQKDERYVCDQNFVILDFVLFKLHGALFNGEGNVNYIGKFNGNGRFPTVSLNQRYACMFSCPMIR